MSMRARRVYERATRTRSCDVLLTHDTETDGGPSPRRLALVFAGIQNFKASLTFIWIAA